MSARLTLLERLFSIFEGHGCGLPSHIEDDLKSLSTDRRMAKITRNPHLHLALELAKGKFVDRLKQDASLAQLGALLIRRLHAQVDGRTTDRRDNDQLSLGARRLFLLCSENMAFMTQEHRETFVRQQEKLPIPSLFSGKAMLKAATSGAIRNFLSASLRLQLNIQKGSQGDNSDLGDFEDNSLRGLFDGDDVRLAGRQPERFKNSEGAFTGKTALSLRENSAYTQMMAGATIFEAIAPRWFADWIQGGELAERSDDELFHALIWMVEIFFGLPPRDILDLALPGGSSTLSCLSPGGLRLLINGGHYVSAKCWIKDELLLPLPLHLRNLVEELVRRFPLALSVRACFSGGNVLDIHRTRCRSLIKHYLRGYKTNATRMDRVWYRMAILGCDLPTSLAGLLRGHPIGGGRGQSAYLSVACQTVIDASLRIQRQVYHIAGIPFEAVPFTIENPEHLYGKRAMTLQAFATITLDHIKAATTFNDLIACTVRVFQGLGFRRRNATQNPVCLFRDDRMPLVEVGDKLVGEWTAPRFIPISPSFEKVIGLLRQVIGDHPTIYYQRSGSGCAFGALSSVERVRLQTILNDDAHHNAGRTGLYNALLARSCGDLIRQVILGHGPRATHLYGNQLPIPPRRLLDCAQSFMISVCAEEGLDACAQALAAKLEELIKSASIPKAPSAMSNVQETPIPPEIHPPMTYLERLQKEKIYSRYFRFQFPRDYETSKISFRPKEGWPLDETGLLAAVALELDLPLALLLDYQSYYTYQSILFDTRSRQVFLRVIFGHHDAGGLSAIPVRICSFDDAAANRLLGLLRYRLGAAVFARERKAMHSAREYDRKKGSPARVIEYPELRPLHDLAQSEMAARAIEGRLFGDREITKEDVGDKLAKLLGFDPSDPLKAFDLFNRIADCRCAVSYPPLLAGVFSGRSLLGLNHFSLQDLFNARNEESSPIEDLLGRPWVEEREDAGSTHSARQIEKLQAMAAALSAGDLTRLFSLSVAGVRHGEIPPNDTTETDAAFMTLKKAIGSLTAGDWKLFLPEDDDAVRRKSSPERMAAFLRGAKFSNKVVRKVAADFGAFLRREAKLSLSTPLPLLSRAEMDRVIREVQHSIGRDYHARNNKRSNLRERVTSEEIRPELNGLTELLSETGFRPKEARNFYREDIVEDAVYAHFAIRGGKTDNARRIITIRKDSIPFCHAVWTGEKTLLQGCEKSRPRGGTRAFNRLYSHHAHHASVSMNLSRRLRKVSGKPMKPYDLRHHWVVFDVSSAIETRLGSGNLGHVVADLSVKVGHGSTIFTMATYLGAAVFLFIK